MGREPAWRVFSAEFNASREVIKAEEKKKPSYVVTPLGAKISRVFIVGVLTEAHNVNDEVITARVADHTGAFHIFAGKFTPRARQFLDSTAPPKFVAVVGKTNVYRPNEDTMYVSVVPEHIKIVDEVLRDYWMLDTAKKLKLRVEAMKEALSMEEPTVDKLIKLGFTPRIADGVVTAINLYGRINVETYVDMLKNALKHLLPEYREMGYEPPGVEEEEEPDDFVELETRILQIIDELNTGAGAEYSEILKAMPDVEPAKIDQILDSLKDRGEIYERGFGAYFRA
ncbi:MAG: hypothetical protein GXO25_01890 [Euryarchaeota archaeon]|nr:hypothetical protein [Euryarchaeota archaeon]